MRRGAGRPCTIPARYDHRDKAGGRRHRRPFARSSPAPGTASRPCASGAGEGRRRLGQCPFPPGGRVGGPSTSPRGVCDADRARATVAASVVRAIAGAGTRTCSCRGSQSCSAGRGPSSDGFLARVSCMPPPRTRSQRARRWNAFFARSISLRRWTPRAIRGEVYRSRRAPRHCTRISNSSTASWTEPRCSACGTARYRRRRGPDLRCGSTEIFIRATC